VEEGHDVTQLTSTFPGARSSVEIDGVRIRRIGRLRTGSFHLRVQRELARLRGYDLIVESVNTFPFLTPLWGSRLPPSVAVFHQLAEDVWDSEFPRPLAALGRRLERVLLAPYRETAVAAVSDSTRTDLERLGFENVTVVPNGRDKPPDVGHVEKELHPTFLFVGRLAANKRPDHAVRALRTIQASIPEARLWIVGQGPMERDLARDLPRGAALLGRLPRRELYERMAAAHCLVVPSVREGWGLVVIEANSVGTPAVGYDIPGIRDSIRPGPTGRLAVAGDPESLAEQALTLIADREAYEDTRLAAIEWATSFSWDATAEALLELARSRSVQRHEAVAPPLLVRSAAR
jgi:glycosyltransferase involved in cell wall biosynthesis